MNNNVQNTMVAMSQNVVLPFHMKNPIRARQQVKRDVLVIDNVHCILNTFYDYNQPYFLLNGNALPYVSNHIRALKNVMDSSEESFIKDLLLNFSGIHENQYLFHFMLVNILQESNKDDAVVPRIYFSQEDGLSIYKVSQDNIGSIYSEWKFIWLWDIKWVSWKSKYYLWESEKVLYGSFHSWNNNSRKIYSYEELSSNYNFFSQDASYYKEIHNPITFYFIERNLWISFVSLHLLEQIKFIHQQDKDVVWKIQIAYKKYGEDFLRCFLYVLEDIEISKFLLEHAQYDDMESIFYHFASVPSIVSSLIDGVRLPKEEIDRFIKMIYGKFQSAFKAFVDPEKPLQDNNLEWYYELPTSIKKSLLGVLLTQKWEEASFLDIESFNDLSHTFQINTFAWWDLLSSTDIISMDNPDNYKYPEKFWYPEYRMLSSNIEKTYWDVDNWWSHVLKRSIPKELQNKDVTFYFIKDKEENRPIACIKSKQLPNGDVYVGSIYVDRCYTGEACIWKYLVNLMYDNNPEGTVYKWLVSVYAQSVQFHTLFATNYFEGISYDADENGTSEALFVIDSSAHNKWKFKTERFSGWKISTLAKESEECQFSEDIEYVVIDGSEENKNIFIPFVEKWFHLWYCITRMFHEKKAKDINRKRTYIVFEKPNF